ncbi:MAG TPA: DUF2079 domain-containing protein [Chloroflexota bacterium]|nr:DUF2079 domain-containing protein [Chloroflexota bacterium]
MTDPLRPAWRAWGARTVLALALAWAAGFGWLAVQRHLAGGSHAEDLGFTDQVLANFLRGQFFRMSIYQGATWNTEIDLSRVARPDSLLAFHFEPMLLLLVPLYALGGGAVLLLIVQAIAVAAGALPAYRLGAYTSGSVAGGVAVAVAYLLSPLGQWAVLADFHTSTLAAPLLVLAVERLVVKQSAIQALAVAAMAASAREDVGLAIAALGLVLLVRPPSSWRFPSSPPYAAARLPSDELSVTTNRHADRHAQAEKRHAGVMWTSQNGHLALIGLGVGSTILGALVIRSYSGGVSPFDVRYGATLGAGPGAALAALGRPTVLGALGTLALSGGWLGLLSPLALLPALPALALNALSASPWMAAGKAHYSSLILPFITVGAAAGLQRLRAHRARMQLAAAALTLTSAVGYVLAGAGPLAGNYAPPLVTEHALRAQALADSLPPNAVVSASSALVPRISRRPSVYVFPAVLDAEYVFLDVQSSPAPTSAGDTFLRVRALLADGGWTPDAAADGLLLLRRVPNAPPMDIADLPHTSKPRDETAQPLTTYLDGRVRLLSATLMPSPDAAIDVDGPRGRLHTLWRAEQPLPTGTHLDFWLDLRDGQRLHVWDIAPLWWDPPDRWTPGETVAVDVPDVPMRQFLSWQADWTSP